MFDVIICSPSKPQETVKPRVHQEVKVEITPQETFPAPLIPNLHNSYVSPSILPTSVSHNVSSSTGLINTTPSITTTTPSLTDPHTHEVNELCLDTALVTPTLPKQQLSVRLPVRLVHPIQQAGGGRGPSPDTRAESVWVQGSTDEPSGNDGDSVPSSGSLPRPNRDVALTTPGNTDRLPVSSSEISDSLTTLQRSKERAHPNPLPSSNTVPSSGQLDQTCQTIQSVQGLKSSTSDDCQNAVRRKLSLKKSPEKSAGECSGMCVGSAESRQDTDHRNKVTETLDTSGGTLEGGRCRKRPRGSSPNPPGLTTSNRYKKIRGTSTSPNPPGLTNSNRQNKIRGTSSSPDPPGLTTSNRDKKIKRLSDKVTQTKQRPHSLKRANKRPSSMCQQCGEESAVIAVD